MVNKDRDSTMRVLRRIWYKPFFAGGMYFRLNGLYWRVKLTARLLVQDTIYFFRSLG